MFRILSVQSFSIFTSSLFVQLNSSIASFNRNRPKTSCDLVEVRMYLWSIFKDNRLQGRAPFEFPACVEDSTLVHSYSALECSEIIVGSNTKCMDPMASHGTKELFHKPQSRWTSHWPLVSGTTLELSYNGTFAHVPKTFIQQNSICNACKKKAQYVQLCTAVNTCTLH